MFKYLFFFKILFGGESLETLLNIIVTELQSTANTTLKDEGRPFSQTEISKNLYRISHFTIELKKGINY